ncbi:elongin C [Ceratocystis pirilliformis]|uniref:Elongin-C n=1 Tax=Ceratocystis pirilliformis TaxID=259994 RepID=A0ABR3YDI5_9PEZI
MTTPNISPQDYVTLVSGDGYEFVVARKLARLSPVINGMLECSNFQEGITGVCEFPEISGIILDLIVDYFHYWFRWKDYDGDVPNMDIPVELCLELLVASDYLGLDSSRQLATSPK